MPFKSKKQVAWMFSQKPEMAKRWAKETPSIKSLPLRKKKTMKAKMKKVAVKKVAKKMAKKVMKKVAKKAVKKVAKKY